MGEGNDAERLFQQILGVVGGSLLTGAIAVADQSGLLQAMHPDELESVDAIAERAGISARYARELLSALAAARFLDYEVESDRFRMTATQAACLADEDSPTFVGGWTQIARSLMGAVPEVVRAAREGSGVPFEAYGEELVVGMERMDGPATRRFLVSAWLARAPRIVERLESGARAADVGCGAGVATVTLAKAFPHSTFVGYDLDERSLARARALARQENVTNVTFEKRDILDLPTEPAWDFVLSFRTLHDLPHPRAVLRRIHDALAPGASLFVVEPPAVDALTDDPQPHIAFLYAHSALHCLAVGSEDDGEGLGCTFVASKVERYAREAGFRGFTDLSERGDGFYELRA